MEDLPATDGYDRLIDSLEAAGSGPLSLPGLDDPTPCASYMRMVLVGCRDRGFEFESAWSAGINRLQAPADNGLPDPELSDALREERALLEDLRPMWQAAYEGREPTLAEKARHVVSFWRFEETAARSTEVLSSLPPAPERDDAPTRGAPRATPHFAGSPPE